MGQVYWFQSTDLRFKESVVQRGRAERYVVTHTNRHVHTIVRFNRPSFRVTFVDYVRSIS